VLVLLNILSGIALLVWGTYLVRTSVLRVYGAQLRRFLATSVNSRMNALFAGLGVTGVLQSSTATALLTTSFAGSGLIATAPALAIMLGADIGTALAAVFLSRDLTWLSPLLIFGGVIVFLSKQRTNAEHLGRTAIGLGLMMLALQLIIAATKPLTQAAGMKAILTSISGDPMLDVVIAAVVTLLAYSSLAVVLLTATLTSSAVIGLDTALALVIGANIGSGLLAVLMTLSSPPEVRRVPLGNLLFKLLGGVIGIAANGLTCGADCGGVPLNLQHRIGRALPWSRASRRCHCHFMAAQQRSPQRPHARETLRPTRIGHALARARQRRAGNLALG
jgi:phosphate:Na+ symporter